VLHDLRRRAAAVHVENVSANFLRHLSSHAHALYLSSKDLHRKRPLVFVKAHLPFRLRIASRQTLYGNELGNRQANTATPLQQTSKRDVRYSTSGGLISISRILKGLISVITV
jgi:hypothetical protein